MEGFCLFQEDIAMVTLNDPHSLTFSISTQNFCQFRIRKEVLFTALVQNRKEVASLPLILHYLQEDRLFLFQSNY